MTDAIASIVSFVEERIEPADFERLLYADPEIERTLADDPTLKAETYIGSRTFLFLLDQDFSSPDGVLNVQGALSQFLERRHIAFTPSESHAELFDILLEAQPAWLDVPFEWLKENLLPAANRRRGKELRDWLRQQLLASFKCRDKPPKWIQNPDWPIGQNGPLVFLGQIQLSNYFHDDAAAYLFHDPKSGRCETIIQVC